MKGVTLYTKGGTTMVTVHQVAQAVAGALEKGKGCNESRIIIFNLAKESCNSINYRILH